VRFNPWRERRQLLTFGLIGGLSAAIDAGVFWLLTSLGMWPALATVISFLSAFLVNYPGNAKVVFRARHSSRTLRRYVILVVFNLGLSTGVVELLVLANVIPIVAKLVSIVIVAIVNFTAMRNWVFRPPKHSLPVLEGDQQTAQEERR
jgi:putative flippase GtrA